MTGTLSAVGTTANCTPSGSDTVHVSISTVGFGGAVFTLIGGGFTGTVSFYSSGDGGTTWAPLAVTPSLGGTPVTSANPTGAIPSVFQVNPSAYTHVCALMTTDTAGTLSAKIHLSPISARVGGSSGGGGGMIYPSAGLAQSTGTAWASSIAAPAAVLTWLGTPNSTNLGLANGSEVANTFFAAPNGAAGPPTFRALTGADIPYQTVTLDSLASMIGNSSLNNGSNELTWGWTPTMARASLNFGELTAATGGSVVSGLSNQPIMQLSTVSGSTAAPLYLYQAGLTSASGSPAPPALQINSTWNNTGVTDSGIVESITNTVSGAGSTLLNLLVGGTSVYSISPQGNTTAAGTATAGTFASTSTTGPALKVANTSGASINATVPTALITIAGGTDAVNNGISGAFIGRGANNSSSVAAASAGSAYLQGGSLTTAGSAGSFGLVQVDAYYWRGTIANSGDVVCQTTTAYTVSDCAVTPAVNVIGVVSGTIGNPAQVAIEGTAGVHIDNTATIGDFICLSTTTAGLGHDNGAVICPTAGAQVGIVTAVSGTPDSITLSTTFPAVTLHFR